MAKIQIKPPDWANSYFFFLLYFFFYEVDGKDRMLGK